MKDLGGTCFYIILSIYFISALEAQLHLIFEYFNLRAVGISQCIRLEKV